VNHIEELENAIAYAIGRLDTDSQGCPPQEELASCLRSLADERASWIEVAVTANKDLDTYLETNGVELPYGMPVDGVMQLVRLLRA